MKLEVPDPAYVRERLDYNPVSGLFVWKTKFVETDHDTRWNGKNAGKVAGNTTKEGYVVIRVNGRNCYAQQLAWAWVHGVWPSMQVDHRDRNKSNNRICNLRLATPAQNSANRDLPKGNTSGIKGVDLYRTGRWRAAITVNSKRRHLGYFDTQDEARRAYSRASAIHFGEFSNPA